MKKMTPKLTFLLLSTIISAALAGCSQSSDSPSTLTPAQAQAQSQDADKAIAAIQASNGTPAQKAQAIAGIRARAPQPKS
jgi:hypothetical protein